MINVDVLNVDVLAGTSVWNATIVAIGIMASISALNINQVEDIIR